MEQTIAQLVQNTLAADKDLRYNSYLALMEMTEQKVDWVYEVWDTLAANTGHKNNHTRAIVGQLLCNLAKSDGEHRIRAVFPKLMILTRDEMFVTARHCLLSLWKIGLTGEENLLMVLEGLAGRYMDCVEEKNCKLIRSDIIESLRDLHRAIGDERVSQLAAELIEKEPEEKYRKKFRNVWKKRPAPTAV